jgi:membrane protease YdiL (CAAX protease family)
MSRDSWKKAFLVFIEFLGVTAGCWAFFLFFRPAKFLAPLVNLKGAAAVLFDGFLSVVRLSMICLVAAGLAYLVRKAKDGWTLKDLGFRIHKSWLGDIWLGIVAFSLTNVISLPWTIAVFPIKAQRAGAGFMNEWNAVLSPAYVLALAWILSALATFISAFWEEIHWRGYVQSLFSRKYAPIVGFYVSFLYFSIGHYFNNPRWTQLDVFGAVIGGFSMGLAFYATRSLLVVAVIHTLSNLWWELPFYQYLKGSRPFAYGLVIGLGILTLLLCFIGRKQVAFFWAKIKELFATAGWKMSGLGILLGVLALVFNWGQSLLMKAGRSTTALVLFIFSVFALVVTFFTGKHGLIGKDLDQKSIGH